MTLGERIQLKRKESGMSQESLGDKLDVSRQTVYKWENDQATPELSKLIAMAELFNVKVGWLIAEEESESANVSYDEIIDKVIQVKLKSEETPKQPEGKSYSGKAILSFVLLVFFVVFYTSKMMSLENKYNNLDRQLQNNYTYTQREISQITSNVQNALDNFNNITLNSAVKVTAYDYENDMMQFELNAQPKVYTTGMTTVFHVTADGKTTDFSAVEEDRIFYAKAQAPMNAEEVIVSVEFINGEVSESRNLITFNYIVEKTWPFYDIIWQMGTALNNSKTGFDEQYCEVIRYGNVRNDAEIELPKIISEVMYLTENGVKVADYVLDTSYNASGPKPEIKDGQDAPGFMYFKRPDKLKLDPNKSYEEHLIVTDEYGRQMELISSEHEVRTYYYSNNK